MSIVAALQMNSSASVDENLAYISDQLSIAEQAGVELLVLPENFAQIPGMSDQRHVEQMGSGPVQEFLADYSRRHAITLVGGSVPVIDQPGQLPLARCLVFCDGEMIASYDKIHLFDVDLPGGARIRESETYRAGSIDRQNQAVVDTKTGRLGLSICYDLRFPELYRQLVSDGASVLSVPAAFTRQTGRVHWQTLLTARAIENQCFVVAAAQVWTHADNRRCWGHSMIIDPWGNVLAVKKSGIGLVLADIDLTKLADIRATFPALKHRRLHYE